MLIHIYIEYALVLAMDTCITNTLMHFVLSSFQISFYREDVGCEFNDPSVQSRDTLRDVRSWWVLFTIDLHKVWTNMKVAFKV
jgi:hypothetical protein